MTWSNARVTFKYARKIRPRASCPTSGRVRPRRPEKQLLRSETKNYAWALTFHRPSPTRALPSLPAFVANLRGLFGGRWN